MIQNTHTESRQILLLIIFNNYVHQSLTNLGCFQDIQVKKLSLWSYM